MKINVIKSKMVASGWNIAISIASVCLVSIAFISGAAQLKTDKHITSVQLGSAADGARVTVVSDAGLSDYEAFRRGERFYVRIPAAEFATVQPSFHGDGFDDVQVQRVGDSVVISFKLQPGASARVDQRGNRLDVIFTSLARAQRGNPASAANTRPASVTTPVNTDRRRDTAGPAPSESSSYSRERVVNEARPIRTTSQRSAKELSQTASSETNRHASSSPTVQAPVALPSPASQPSYPAWTNSPATVSTPATSGPRSSSYSTGSTANGSARTWFAANRKSVLLAGLIVSAIAAALAFVLYRRPRTKARTGRTKPVLSQPKYATEPEQEVAQSEPAAAAEPMYVESADVIAADEQVPDWRSTPVPPADETAKAALIANGDTNREDREVFEL
ncbi:MAG TPA: hypothetical protein VJT50_07140 [Pyrinomonadaceae bacterium]|nr:hypothetical protein [Pyrinomonadaceae bacterium]